MSETELPGEKNIALPREVDVVVKTLARKHGGGVLRHESNGLHLYLPCPECLALNGTKEIHAKHLTINIDKCFGLGKFKRKAKHQLRMHNGVRDQFAALCHKTNKKFTVGELIDYKSIEKRGIPGSAPGSVSMSCSNAVLTKDENGKDIPFPPGKVTPVMDLPADHPAVTYLTNRGYDPVELYKHMEVSYCYEETPPDKRDTPPQDKRGIYYRYMPDDWRDTPQGRIIFYARIRGAAKGWQARVIDHVADGWKYYWHPYREEWVPVEKQAPDGTWLTRKDYLGEKYQWKPSKYRMAIGVDPNRGVGRSSILMGYDAARAWCEDNQNSVAVLTEGPLDACRLGPPGLAMLGKYLASNQADLLKGFRKVVVVLDNDSAGQTGLVRVKTICAEKNIRLESCQVPANLKDLGEMSQEAANELISPLLK